MFNPPRFLVLLILLGWAIPSPAQITGSAKLVGKAPQSRPIDMSGCPDCDKLHKTPAMDETVEVDDKNNLANVAVYLQPAEGQTVPAGDAGKKKPALLTQRGCIFVPHVLLVQTGQPMKIRNEDDLAHNVHSMAIDNPPFNITQPAKTDGTAVDSPKVVEQFKVKCDVHPWMSAWIVVVDNPYAAITGADGGFSIDSKDLPDGQYTFVAWHEKYDPVSQTVTVKSGKIDHPLLFEFKSEGK